MAVPRMMAMLLTIPKVPLALVICLYSTNSGMIPSLTGENKVLCTPSMMTQNSESRKFPEARATIQIAASMTSHIFTKITTFLLLYLSENWPAKPPKRMNGTENSKEMVAWPPVPNSRLQIPPVATPSMMICLNRLSLAAPNACRMFRFTNPLFFPRLPAINLSPRFSQAVF